MEKKCTQCGAISEVGSLTGNWIRETSFGEPITRIPKYGPIIVVRAYLCEECGYVDIWADFEANP